MLDVVEQLRKKSSSSVFAFLKAVLAKTFPQPGETLSIQTFEGQNFKLKRSENNFMLESVSFSQLFKSCGISTVLDIFAGLMCESRLIVLAQNVTKLSSCVNALTALLYPFTWQHVYIPILPKALMSYCCAPMPFIVGVLASNLPELNTYPLEECVLLDIDSGKTLRELPPDCNYKKTLPSAGLALRKSVDDILRSGRSPQATDVGISQAFLNFFYMIFANYTGFINKDHKFNREEFKKGRPKDVQKFLEHLEQTQLYEMFIRERELMSKNGTLDSCALTKERFSAVSIKTNEALSNEPGTGNGEVVSLSTCRRCNKDIDDTDDLVYLEKKGKAYCKKCYTEKKASTKEKFKSALPSIRGVFKNHDDDGEDGEEKESKLTMFLNKASEKMQETAHKVGGYFKNKDKNDDSGEERTPSSIPESNSSTLKRSIDKNPPSGALSTSQNSTSSNSSSAPTSPATPSSSDPKKMPQLPPKPSRQQASSSGSSLVTTSAPSTPMLRSGSQSFIVPGSSANKGRSMTGPHDAIDHQKTKPLPPPPKGSGSASLRDQSPTQKPPVRKVTYIQSGGTSNAESPSEGECAFCGKAFSNEEVVNALQKLWHKQCFLCAQCGKGMTDSFAQKDGQPYHLDCIKLVLPKCERCKDLLKGKVFNVEGRRYHEHCFVCESCGKSLTSLPYLTKGGLNYCKDCSSKDSTTSNTV